MSKCVICKADTKAKHFCIDCYDDLVVFFSIADTDGDGNVDWEALAEGITNGTITFDWNNLISTGNFANWWLPDGEDDWLDTVGEPC